MSLLVASTAFTKPQQEINMLRQSSGVKRKPTVEDKRGLQKAQKKDNMMRRRKISKGAKEREDLMVPMAGGSSQGAMTRVTVKTDQEILQLAIKDISVVRDALSSEAPVKKLKTAKNLMKAYGEFMKKGRIEGSHPRTWEKEPASELFCRGLVIFSETVEDYSTYKERAPTQAKKFALCQWMDANPIVFGARMPT